MKKTIIAMIMCLFLLSASFSVFAEELDTATFDFNTFQDESQVGRNIPAVNDVNTDFLLSNEVEITSELREVSLSGATLTVNQLKKKFPNGYFWNHYGTVNNPDKYTSQPCATHNGNGNPDCNFFDGALQCMGFAFKLGFDYSGTSPRYWQKVYTLNGLAVGDIIRYQNDGHSVFVTATNAQGGISLAECNGITPSTYCKITWDRYITKNQILNDGFSYVLKCPPVTHTHSYTAKGINTGHPHNEYWKCSTCGNIRPAPNTYTGNVIFVASCAQCKAIGKPANVKSTVSNKSVTVTWNKTPYTNHYNVYLVASPWRWADIKYSGKTTNASYTFANVAKGEYKAFVIARPNLDSTQSGWVSTVVAPPNTVALTATPSVLTLGNAVTLTPSAKNVIKYNLRVTNANGNVVYTKSNFTGNVTWTPTEPGTYTAWVSAINDIGFQDSPKITFSVQNPTSPEPPINPTPGKFTDIPSGAWYESYVYHLTEKGILSGKGHGIFDPQGNITRAEFATILAKASGDGLDSYNKEGVFPDSNSHWARKFINWAYAKKIVYGKENGYAPDDNITRQEMAVMINRYANYKKVTLPKKAAAITFNDDANIDKWAKDSVSVMQQAGIINGKGNGIFDPKGNATRAEASTMISIFLKL